MSAAVQAIRRINPALPIVVGLLVALAAIGAAFSDRFGTLREYIVLLGSLTAYGASAIVCVAVTLCSDERFDFALLGERVVSFQQEGQAALPRISAQTGPRRAPGFDSPRRIQ